MIRIENIGKVFNAHSRNRNEVLKGVSFELPEKGFIAIYGKSGSGKTTLLNIIGGLDRQDSGKIYIDGENVAGKVDKIRNAKIGFIFQNYYLERGYTIAEIMRNAMHIAGFKDEAEIERRSEEVLALVDMERFKNKQGDALSGGQKQRVAIARALIKGADVILADEPTGNLDAENTMKVMDILKEISKTRLVVVVTHEITLIKKYADSYIKLVDGRLDENTDLGEVFQYDTEHNNIYVDEKPRGEVKEGALDIEFYGDTPAAKDTIQVFNDKGNIYIKAGANVTVLDERSEKKIIFRGTQAQEEEQPARLVPDFAKSTAKRNGRLFTGKSIFKLFRSDGSERAYSTANIFKQIFIFVIAAVLCFLSLMAFEAANTRIENKVLDSDSVYVNMNTYTDLRTLDTNLYENIDFFETQYKQGSFSYNEIASLSGISADYAPKAIEADDTAESVGLTYGDYRVVANANARQHGGVRAYPHVFSYHDGRRLHTFPTLGIQVVIECCKHNLMTDQSAVAYGYAALVLKTASGIYEHVFAYRYVFAAVGVKGRKQQKRFVCFFANQPEKQFAYFFGRKIFSVYFRRNFLRVASQNMHTSVRVGVCGDIRIFFDKFNVFFCIHIFKSFNLFYV